MKPTLANAVRAIDRDGALLTFPINNQPEPASLWSRFYPRTKMKWEWDENGDYAVSDLWHLRERLSRSGKVVYAKWFQYRATFFSRDLFPAWLFRTHQGRPDKVPLSHSAQKILTLLEEDSPLSSKILKARAKEIGVTTKPFEKALKELWACLYVVGYGEVDDGAFPSLAIGATSLMFDDLWTKSLSLSPEKADKIIREFPVMETRFYEYLLRMNKKMSLEPRKLPKTLTYDQLSRFK